MTLPISSRETPKTPKAELGKAKVSVRHPPSVAHSIEPMEGAEAHTRSSKQWGEETPLSQGGEGE